MSLDDPVSQNPLQEKLVANGREAESCGSAEEDSVEIHALHPDSHPGVDARFLPRSQTMELSKGKRRRAASIARDALKIPLHGN